MDKLEQAIQAIKSGQKNDGLRLLIELVKENPRNEQAWLWLGGTLPDVEKRKDCLRRVLQINPDNQQAARMLHELDKGREKKTEKPDPEKAKDRDKPSSELRPSYLEREQPSAPESKPAPISEEEAESQLKMPPRQVSKTDRTTAESKIQRALAMQMKGQTQKGLKSFVAGIDIDPKLVHETFTRSVASELTGLHPDQAIKVLQDPEKRKELLNPKKERGQAPSQAGSSKSAQPSGPAPGLIQSWLSFFGMTEDFFYRVVGQANTEDTLISVFVYMIASIVTFLVSSLGQLQQVSALMSEQLGGQMPDLSPFILIILISMVFLTPISFYLGAGVQFLGMRIFGGSGTFKEHTYVLSLITVPMTVISLAFSLLSLLPVIRCIAGLAGLGISIWGLIVTVRGYKVVHNLSTGQTIAGILVPPIIIAVIFGCLFAILGNSLMGVLENVIATQGGMPQ